MQNGLVIKPIGIKSSNLPQLFPGLLHPSKNPTIPLNLVVPKKHYSPLTAISVKTSLLFKKISETKSAKKNGIFCLVKIEPIFIGSAAINSSYMCRSLPLLFHLNQKANNRSFNTLTISGSTI